MTEVTKNVTEVAKNVCRTKNVTVYHSISQNIAVYRRISQYIAGYRRISQYIAVYCSISHYIAFSRGHRSKFIWSCFTSTILSFTLRILVKIQHFFCSGQTSNEYQSWSRKTETEKERINEMDHFF